jgi:hypothetical protein
LGGAGVRARSRGSARARTREGLPPTSPPPVPCSRPRCLAPLPSPALSPPVPPPQKNKTQNHLASRIFCPGRYTASISPQHSRSPSAATGSATANHASHEGGSPPADMRSIAKMFWGEDIGDVMPPARGLRNGAGRGGGGYVSKAVPQARRARAHLFSTPLGPTPCRPHPGCSPVACNPTPGKPGKPGNAAPRRPNGPTQV